MPALSARLDIGMIAALVTWGVVAVIALGFGGGLGEPRMLVAVALLLVNAAAMLAVDADRRLPRRMRLSMFWVQLASALALGAVLRFDFLQILTIIWIAMSGAFLSVRQSALALLAIIGAWFVQMQFLWGHERPYISIALFSTFHLFALLMSLSTQRAEAATAIAEARNRELRATQHLLAQAAAQSERSRIARNLHDLLGHHLTALTIKLQVAARQSDGELKARIEQCHGLTRLLLSDVREAVSTLSESDRIDLAAAVELMAGETPGLTIEADIDPKLEIADVRTAEALLRCIQEGLTNTLRHAGASVFHICLEVRDDRLELTMSDDGEVKSLPVEGNGLRGMRERIEQLRGRFELARRNRSVHISISVPV